VTGGMQVTTESDWPETISQHCFLFFFFFFSFFFFLFFFFSDFLPDLRAPCRNLGRVSGFQSSIFPSNEIFPAGDEH